MKVLVAMSGGVDSSVAALLLREEGHEVAGGTMCLGISSTPGGRPVCCGEEAVGDARSVCDLLGIPHSVLDYSSRLEDAVIGPFVAGYSAGLTPNPCVECNLRLKFGALLDTALALGFDALATGHYAGVAEKDGKTLLVRGLDRAKDQSYFLALVTPRQLRRTVFPLARLTKEEVREKAARAGLPVSRKAESQEICFVRGDYRTFLRGRGVPFEPGPIVDPEGRELGRHSGLAGYTVGQRGGLGISAPRPLYVLAKDAASNRLVVGPRGLLAASGLTAVRPNLFMDRLPEGLSARIRHRGREMACHAAVGEGRLRVTFLEQAHGVAPGQTVVLYDGEAVAAGAVIDLVESPSRD